MRRSRRTIVVIGGSQGGPTAAARAREFDEDARIILVERRPFVSWVKAGLAHQVRGEADGLSGIAQDRSSFFQSRYGIEVRTGCEAVGLDNDARRILLRQTTESGAPPDAPVERLGYDAIIFAGGATTNFPNIEGLATGPGICTFRKVEDFDAIDEAVKAGAQKAVIMGGGRFGLEAADALKARGLEVTVVERDARPLRLYSLTASAAVARLLEEQGIKLLLQEDVSRVSAPLDGAPTPTRRKLTLASGKELDADIIVVATGMLPQSHLLREAGASVHADGTIRVTPYMETTLPHVYACGTAVSVPHAVTGGATWLIQNAIIDRTAQIAGRSAAVGPDGDRESLSPSAATHLHRVGDHWFGRTGLSDSEARSALGDDRVSVVTIHSTCTEPWLKGDMMCVRIVIDKKHRRVVGGEVWGREGIARRTDILAAAVLERWTPARLRDLDVAYAPSLGPAFDPVNAAGAMAQMDLEGLAQSVAPEVLAARLVSDTPPQVVDVSRDRREGDKRPKGALHIPLEELRDRLGELDPARPVAVISHTGRRAYVATRILAQRGFSNVTYLDGGAISWALVGSPS